MAGLLEGSYILVADDERAIRDVVVEVLEMEGARVRAVSSGTEALQAFAEEEPDLALLDVRMPAPDGLAVLQQLREQGSEAPVLIVTAQDSSQITISAIQSGAYDYVAKPFDLDKLLVLVHRALEYRRLTRLVAGLEQAHTNNHDAIIGYSSAMQEVYKLIGRVADSDSTVLITGESGTGKELVATVLHQMSKRRERSFVAVNCAALAETLLESELFGHEKGAFTGALAQRKGRFEQSNKGTLFLDEIGEISAATQKKLLRVLQERTFERVGGNTTIAVDVRLIAATNRDLLSEAERGNFREDLYYRLNVINIHMPPLRERLDDIPLLVQHFLQAHAQPNGDIPAITDAALAQLQGYTWPGNVRQLQNTIERAVVLAQGRIIDSEHVLLADIQTPKLQVLEKAIAQLLEQHHTLPVIMQEVRRQVIATVLEANNHDQAQAAQQLGITEAELSSGLLEDRL